MIRYLQEFSYIDWNLIVYDTTRVDKMFFLHEDDIDNP